MIRVKGTLKGRYFAGDRQGAMFLTLPREGFVSDSSANFPPSRCDVRSSLPNACHLTSQPMFTGRDSLPLFIN